MKSKQEIMEIHDGAYLPSPIIHGRPLRIGIIAAPGLPNDKVRQIYKELANLFYHHVDTRRLWQVSLEVDPLIGAHDNTERLLAKAREHKQARYWDYAICITDLPMMRKRKLTVAEANTRAGIAYFACRQWPPYS